MVLDELITRLRFKVDDAGARKSKKNLRDIRKLAGDASKTLRGMRRAMVEAFAARAVLDGVRALGSAVFRTNATFQSLRASLKTVTGSADAAGAAFKRIQKFARETPFTVEQVTRAFIKLKALGLEAGEDALRSYGNTASANGKNVMDFIEAVADATTGEFERLKEFGIKARDQGDKVAFTFRGQTKSIAKDARSIEKFLQSIGDTDFAGAMAEQMKTLGGAASNLRDTFDAFLVAIGEGGLNDAIIEVTKGLGEMLGDSDDLARSIGEFLGNALREAFKLFKDIARGLRDIKREDIAEFFEKARRAIGAVISVVRFLVEAFGKFVDLVGGVENAITVLLPTLAALRLGLGGIHAAAFAAGIALSQAFGEDKRAEIRKTRAAIKALREEERRRDEAASAAVGDAEAMQAAENAEIQRQNRARTEGFGPGLVRKGGLVPHSFAIESPGSETSEIVRTERQTRDSLGPQAQAFTDEVDRFVQRQAKAAGEKAKTQGIDPTIARAGAAAELREREVEARAAFSAALAAGESEAQARKEGLAILRKKKKRAGLAALEGEKKKGGRKKKEHETSSSAAVKSAIDEAVRKTELETFLKRRDLLGDEREGAARAAGVARKAELEQAVKEGRLSALGGAFAGRGTTELLRDAGILDDSQRASPPVLTVTIVKADVDVNAPISVEVANANASAEDIGRTVRRAVRFELETEIGNAIESVLPKQAR